MSDTNYFITSNSWILGSLNSPAVEKAAGALGRDILNTCIITDREGVDVRLIVEKSIEPDCFVVKVSGGELCVSASNDLGLIYGMYHISKHFLGVDEFWFWNEQTFNKRNYYEVPEDYNYQSRPFKVKYRGWFVNDEVLIDGWKLGGDKEKAWEMVFESLLRCGGNMTIPGTDTNAHIYCDLASRMGLWITHHHAEPLGAEMFARAYPDLEASYDKYPGLFEKLWKDAIKRQKNYKVIWNLGFRGQGDRPFWADDKAYDTDEKRGRLISSLIRKQYELVKKADKDAICCSNLYGETMELYQKGLIDLPKDVIFIWADNGFGKMVSRRQGNHNPRVYALPKDSKGRHGIYYHASFYDLQAAAQMTMLPNSPEFVVKELNQVFDKKADDFWIINCSNVKPHGYILGLIADYWKNGKLELPKKNADKEIEEYVENYRNTYCKRYYGNKYSEVIAELYKLWPQYAPGYGPNEDDHAGEQFYNHGARVLTTGFISSFNTKKPSATKAADEWLWFSNKKTIKKQIYDYMKIIEPAVKGYQEYLTKCKEVSSNISKADNRILEDNLIWQIEYNYYSCLGALHTCRAIDACLVNPESMEQKHKDNKEENQKGKQKEEKVIDCISQGEDTVGGPDYLKAFYEAGLAAKAFKDGYDTMRSHEHGVFKGFFDNDCQGDIRQSHYVLCGLMSYVRFHGDGPHFYKWQRMFQEGAGGNKVHLILRVKKHLTDQELWTLMYQQYGEV